MNRKKQTTQLVILALLLAGLMGNVFGNQDDSVSNNNADPAGTTIGEGVVGLVTTDRDAPIADAQILAKSLDSNAPPIPERIVLTMSNGRYEWPLPAGRYELSVVAQGYPVHAGRVTVDSGQVSRLDFVLER
jgi:hypothetical protein